jgi:hypothetical protein
MYFSGHKHLASSNRTQGGTSKVARWAVFKRDEGKLVRPKFNLEAEHNFYREIALKNIYFSGHKYLASSNRTQGGTSKVARWAVFKRDEGKLVRPKFNLEAKHNFYREIA